MAVLMTGVVAYMVQEEEQAEELEKWAEKLD